MDNKIEVNWRNSFKQETLKPWMAHKERFNFLLDSLEVAFPNLHLLREGDVSVFVSLFPYYVYINCSFLFRK
jgi:hypothetical protein